MLDEEDLVIPPALFDAAECVDTLSTTDTLEQVVHVRDQVSLLKKALKAIDKALDERTVDWINEHGDIEIGDVRLYVGTSKTTKPRKGVSPLLIIQAAAAAAFDHNDEAAAEAILSSGWCKHGSVRNVIPAELFDKFFETTVVPDLKTGKPKKQLKKVNQKFLKK